MATRGELILVPTPIGNLEDLTLRALRILKEADHVAAEDTRTTRRLFDHYGISTPLSAYHDFSTPAARRRLVSRLEEGQVLALVSDAGSPGISDPAYRLVQDAIELKIRVTALPGATSIIPALTGSGMPTDSFLYLGFLPRKKGRDTAIKELLESLCTVVALESPHRITDSLKRIAAIAPGRRVCVARELSKIHEEFLRGTAEELAARVTESPLKGEMVLLVEGQSAAGKRLRKLDEEKES
jgi:16S rRNA (cytidine1402-2'-O)-methyltransferase